MKIISLEAENIKKLKAVSIKPDGCVVVIGGENAAGKSSVLDSIQYALGGQKKIDDKPIRDGQDKAKIVLDLDKIVVTRTFTKNGTSLVVKNKDGASFASPQAMLDDLIGQIAFDPLEFSRMEPKRQLESLKKVVGLDFDKLDKKRKSLFDERTIVNRNGKELRSQFDSIKLHEDAPKGEVSIAKLSKELSDAINFNAKLDKDKGILGSKLSRIHYIDGEIEKLQSEKKDLSNIAKKLEKDMSDSKEINTDVIEKQINSAETINSRVRDNIEKKKLEVKLQELIDRSLSLTSELKDIDEQKTEQLKSAKFPIKGLTFTDDNVLLGNIPFSQCSTGEKIKVSVSMGLAMNPKLKILLIRDGSLLDDKNLALISEIVKETDSQIWIERVTGDSKSCTVMIEDGNVVNNE